MKAASFGEELEEGASLWYCVLARTPKLVASVLVGAAGEERACHVESWVELEVRMEENEEEVEDKWRVGESAT